MNALPEQPVKPLEPKLPKVGDIVGGVEVEEATKESIRKFWGREMDWTPRETGRPNHCAESY
jgi:hypothetical protein